LRHVINACPAHHVGSSCHTRPARKNRHAAGPEGAQRVDQFARNFKAVPMADRQHRHIEDPRTQQVDDF
jgi:hypothetical protein